LGEKNNEPPKLKKPIKGHKRPVLSLAFDPNSKRVASSDDDKMLCVWDVETGKLTADLAGHQDNVSSLLFFNEGKNLASASFDNTVKIWDLDIKSWLNQACKKAGRILSEKEKNEYRVDEYSNSREDFCESVLSKESN
jgi:WD40 repeat protein